jgi:hypothetical protein
MRLRYCAATELCSSTLMFSHGHLQMPAVGLPAPTLFDAIMELLDNPHPLDMLSEVTAYGPDGAISRYHNPDNYTKALGGVLRARKNPWKPLLSGRPLADATGVQKTASVLEGTLGMATSGLWFNPRTGTQKVHSFCIYVLVANMMYGEFPCSVFLGGQNLLFLVADLSCRFQEYLTSVMC